MGRSIVLVITVVCAVLGVCLPARAELTAFWRNNPITPAAIADDPTLAAMQSWSVMVANTEGMWGATGLRAMLPTTEVFYRNTSGNNTRPSAAQIAGHPALAFHTYITSVHDLGGGLNSPTILGPFPENQPPVSFGGPADAIPGTFSVTWGDPFGRLHAPGAYEYARLTFPAGMLPTIHPQSLALYYNPQQTVLIPTSIPEPVFSGLAVAGVCVVPLGRQLVRRLGAEKGVILIFRQYAATFAGVDVADPTL